MNCVDCGMAVTYDDTGFWPWRASDGSEICGESGTVMNPGKWGHRINRDEADKAYAEFQAATGKKARHQL